MSEHSVQLMSLCGCKWTTDIILDSTIAQRTRIDVWCPLHKTKRGARLTVFPHGMALDGAVPDLLEACKRLRELVPYVGKLAVPAKPPSWYMNFADAAIAKAEKA